MATSVQTMGASVDPGKRTLKLVMDYHEKTRQPLIRLIDVISGEPVVGLQAVDVTHQNTLLPAQEYGANYSGTLQYIKGSSKPTIKVTLLLEEMQIVGHYESYTTPKTPMTREKLGEMVTDGRNSFFSGNVRSTGKAEVTGIRGSSIDLIAVDEAASLPQRFYSDVKQYGAVGNGIADDTAALQATIGVSPSAKTAKKKREERGKSVFRL